MNASSHNTDFDIPLPILNMASTISVMLGAIINGIPTNFFPKDLAGWLTVLVLGSIAILNLMKIFGAAKKKNNDDHEPVQP